MDAAIRTQIETNPTDRALRVALAERCEGSPEADLIRILLIPEPDFSRDAVRRWFEQHQNWAMDRPGGTFGNADDRRNLRRIHGCPDQIWLGDAFNPIHWPDRHAWLAGTRALAQRMIPNAQAFFPADDPARLRLEAAASRKFSNFKGVLAELFAGPLSDAQQQSLCEAGYQVAAQVLQAAWDVKLILDSSSWDIGRSTGEWDGQYRVLGWAWLGLPPLEPEAELALPPFPFECPQADRKEPPVGPGRPWWRHLVAWAKGRATMRG